MKKNILILFSFCALTLHAQEATLDSQNPKSSKIHIGFSISPDLGYRTLSVAPGADSLQFFIDLQDELQSPVTGFTGGLKLLYPFSPTLFVESGILYSLKGYQYKMDKFFWPDMTVTQGKTVFMYHYFDIPVVIKKHFGIRRTTFYISGGFVNNLLTSAIQKTRLEYDTGEEISKESLKNYVNSYSLSGIVGFGIDHKFNASTHLSINPVGRYQLISLQSRSIREYLWNAGVDVTLFKGF